MAVARRPSGSTRRLRPVRSASWPRLRRNTVLAAIALFLGGSPAVAGPSPAPVTLGSSLRLTGTGAGFTFVRLSRPLKVGAFAAFAASATGAPGPIELVFLNAGQPIDKAPFLIVDRAPIALGGDWGFSGDIPDSTLPAGLYRLYLVAESRTTISIKLPGQRGGRTVLSTRQKVRYRVGTVPVDRPGGRYRQVSETNETWTFRRPGHAMAYAVIDFSVGHLLNIGGCTYDGKPPPEEAILQVCYQGYKLGVSDDAPIPGSSYRTRNGMLVYWFQPRELTVGVYYETTGVITSVSRYNIWLEYLP